MNKKSVLHLTGIISIFLSLFYVLGCSPTGSPVSNTLGTPNPYPTPGVANFPPMIYNDGTQAVFGGSNTFLYSGGGTAGYPSLNSTDFVDKGYGGDEYSYQVSWSAGQISAMSGYSGMVIVGNSFNFSSYANCVFWAKANQSATVQFQDAGSGNNAESLTTTWTQYTIACPGGSQTGYFAVLITSVPVSSPLNVEFDQVQFQ